MDHLTRVPPAAALDIPRQDLTSVAFAAQLLEHIMTTAGSTDLKAGKEGELFVIRLGKIKFSDKTPADTYRKFLYWLVVEPVKITPEEYAKHATAVLDMEELETNEILDLLAEGGMSEFGQRVQEYRRERGGKLAEALTGIEAELGHLPRDLSVLQEEMKKKTGYDDLTSQEIMIALGDKQNLEGQLRT